MAHWNIYEQACGFTFNGPEATLSVDPRFDTSHFSCFISVGNGWGQYSQRLQGEDLTCRIKIHAGTCELKEVNFPIVLKLQNDTQLIATLNGQDLAFSRKGSRLVLARKTKINLDEEFVVATRRRGLEVVQKGIRHELRKSSFLFWLIALCGAMHVIWQFAGYSYHKA